ncbi:MAG TPA: hypothetical protein VKV74_07190 [Bryobacteraceae bacterium]|nr:hypothetical protein [Bryobacteraceae bacterium]
MLGPDADPDGAAYQSLDAGNADCELSLPGNMGWSGILKNSIESGMDSALEELSDPGREFTAALKARQNFFADASLSQRGSEEPRGSDRVLDRPMDAYSANRRHRMRRIADAQQSGPIPSPKAVELHG